MYKIKGYPRMIEAIDEYLHSKIQLHTIPKIYILHNLENNLQYILIYLCHLVLLIWRKDNSVDGILDKNDDDEDDDNDY